jgi:hypothetical protein
MGFEVLLFECLACKKRRPTHEELHRDVARYNSQYADGDSFGADRNSTQLIRHSIYLIQLTRHGIDSYILRIV